MRAKKSDKKKGRRKVSISTSLFWSIATIIIVSITAVVIADSKMLNYVYLLRAGLILWNNADKVEAAYEDPDTFYDTVRRIEYENEVSIEIYYADDKLVYSTAYRGEPDMPPFDYSSAIGDEYIKKLKVLDSGNINERFHFDIRYDDSMRTKREYLVFVKMLENGDRVEIFKIKNDIDDVAKIGVIFVTTMTSTMLSISLLLIYLFIRRFTKPLKEMSRITNKMSRLDFSEKLSEMRGAEIDQLGSSINELSDSLNIALNDLKEKNAKLQDDIEKEHTLEHLRQVFITGVSHELKTPIAIIQGYAEGLNAFMEEDPDLAKKYSEIIMTEAARMNQMILKLLEIIKYESGEYVLAIEDFRIGELFNDWIERNSTLIEEKKIVIENQIERSLIGKGDVIILGSVVNNYLSNAISHCSNENLIKVYAEDNGDSYRINVYNSGKQIAPTDIDKIWASFYRADRAMSRAEGRIGLGLAIVAAIQKLHDMEFGVKNMDDGVVFWFDILKGDIDGVFDRDF